MKLPVEKVPVTQLKLDQENPRLTEGIQKVSEEEIIGQLYRSADLNELLISISTNGYLDIEPLIAMSSPGSDKLIVLEGNRRLSAIRLLREPELCDRIPGLENIKNNIPNVPEKYHESLENILVYKVRCRADARAFLGFKHINGPVKWNAYAKARFAADWYKEIKDTQEKALEFIAQTIGDRHDTVKRMVHAIYVLDQAKASGRFDLTDRYNPRFSFSHLYTALGRTGYMEYLGLATSWARFDPKEDPVLEENLDKLKKVLIWIYGSNQDQIRPVIASQNPDIKRLGEVLANPEARLEMEKSNNLDSAHSYTESIDSRFSSFLVRARDYIWESSRALRAYDGTDRTLLDVAGDIREGANNLYNRMREKYQQSEDAE